MEGLKITLEALQQSFTSRMTAFETDLKKTRSQSPTVNSLATEFDTFRSFIVDTLKTIEQQVAAIAHGNDALEMRSRRDILLLHGVPEHKDEDTIQTFLNLASNHLGMKLTAAAISKSVRLGRPKQDKARPLLVKFSGDTVRDNVWYAKTRFKGTGITISEFLTKMRHKIFMAARDRFGVSNCWTKSGRIVAVGDDGKRHVVVSMSDIERLKPLGSEGASRVDDNRISALEKPASSARNKRAASAKRK